MKINYNETESRLKELTKVVYAMEQAIKIIGRYEHNTEYIKIPRNILQKEINELNEKIKHLKENAIVTYDEDIEFIENLLEESNEGSYDK